jgi:hypothetical protein
MTEQTALTPQWLTAFIDRPADRWEVAVPFWCKVSGTSLSATRGPDGEFATLLPADGDAFLRVQRVGGGGGGHLDVHVPDVGAAVELAQRLGARLVFRAGHAILRSPAGLLWCLVPALTPVGDRLRRPAPVTRPDGVRTRVDQLCIDVPPGRFDVEVGFWHAVTGWTPATAGRRGEFARLIGPPGIPLRLLVQRLDDDPPGGSATCHLDVASSDVDAEVAHHHQDWGAQPLRRTPDWTTLRDPSGFEYCVTSRDPGR